MTDPTPAEELRKAAAGLREWAKDVPRPDFYVAVANLLDTEAGDAEQAGIWAPHAVSPGVLAVARAYRGTEGEKADG